MLCDVKTVLLVGEASGVHRNLAKGLRGLNIDVMHIVQSDATSWKWYDGAFSHERSGILGGISRNFEPFFQIAKLPKFDVISVTNTITSIVGKYTKYADIPLLKRKSDLLAYYALGCDEIGIVRMNPILPYNPCKGCREVDAVLGADCIKDLDPNWAKNGLKVKKYYEYGASSLIEYDHTSQFFDEDNFDRIPFPVDYNVIDFAPASKSDIIKILHTPTRRGFKGTDVVLSAISILRNSRTDFSFEIVEGVAYNEYIARMRDCDIVIDQVNGQSLGMNALEMLAAGKIVLSGADEVSIGYHAGNVSPAFDASPDPQVLADTLSRVLDLKESYGRIASAGRSYIEEIHDPARVAKMFLAGWNKALRKKRGRLR